MDAIFLGDMLFLLSFLSLVLEVLQYDNIFATSEQFLQHGKWTEVVVASHRG